MKNYTVTYTKTVQVTAGSLEDAEVIADAILNEEISKGEFFVSEMTPDIVEDEPEEEYKFKADVTDADGDKLCTVEGAIKAHDEDDAQERVIERIFIDNPTYRDAVDIEVELTNITKQLKAF